MTNEHKCIMADHCKKAGDAEHCHDLCYPYRMVHGESGDGGFMGLSQVPKKYKASRKSNLPIKEDNPQAYEAVTTIIDNLELFIERGIGLYLYSTPNKDNPMGTGTGKTTSATAILNEYLVRRIIEHVTNRKKITNVPAFFVKMAKFQNTYNQQFRGTRDLQDEASSAYYALKSTMMKTDLLVIDDVGLRGSSPAFMNEFYEIIDERASEDLATIYTSNTSLDDLGEILSEQIKSRIHGTTEQIDFQGKDHRRLGN